MIQQLQDEISQLRHRLKAQGGDGHVMLNTVVQHMTSRDPQVHQLLQKLKQAARDIRQLAADKQQLIEIGNRLRAELQQYSAYYCVLGTQCHTCITEAAFCVTGYLFTARLSDKLSLVTIVKAKLVSCRLQKAMNCNQQRSVKQMLVETKVKKRHRQLVCMGASKTNSRSWNNCNTS